MNVIAAVVVLVAVVVAVVVAALICCKYIYIYIYICTNLCEIEERPPVLKSVDDGDAFGFLNQIQTIR